MTGLTVRPATTSDHAAIWAMLEPVFAQGETYCVDPHIGRADGLDYWLGGGHRVFLALDGDTPLGTYFLCPNQKGGGAHVCNCGFVTATEARGKGVARTMLAHALATARGEGYLAMQFNFVVSSNTRAIAIWQEAGFSTVGRLPAAFRHPTLGLIDALIMFRDLGDSPAAKGKKA